MKGIKKTAAAMLLVLFVAGAPLAQAAEAKPAARWLESLVTWLQVLFGEDPGLAGGNCSPGDPGEFGGYMPPGG